jgi:methyl-accepting chemotaxis protein
VSDDRRDEPSHLGLTKRSAGRIMVVIAYVGVISALVGAVVGWQFLGELSNANKQGLVLAEETLSAVDTSLEVAQDVVDAVDEALAALGSTILAVGDSIDATTAVASSTAQLATTLPDTIDRIDNGLGSLESIAGTVDNTLGALNRIPLAPDYNPDVPLSEAISNLRADIAPLADNIRATTTDLDTFSTSADDLNAQLVDLAGSVDDVRTAVAGTTDVITQAQASSDDAHALAQSTLSEIGNQLALSRLLLVIIAIAIAIGQIVPYWVGRELLEAPVVVVADLDEVSRAELHELALDEMGLDEIGRIDPDEISRADPDRRADPDQA